MEILDLLKNSYHIDPVIMALVFCAGAFQKTYTKNLFAKVSGALKTLIISFVFFICYIMVKACAGTFENHMLEQYFISYTVATSFYELLYKNLISRKPVAPVADDPEA